jgi:hypothetical protein
MLQNLVQMITEFQQSAGKNYHFFLEMDPESCSN